MAIPTYRCTAHRQDGSPCKAMAVKGATVCRVHGGNARQVRAKAAERVAEAELRVKLDKLGISIETDPLTALLGQVWESAGNLSFLREKVQELGQDLMVSTAFGPFLDGYVKLYNEERERLAKMAKLALDAGVSERQVRLAEQQGAMVADLIRKVLDDPDLGLSPEQQERGRAIASSQLRLLGA